MDLPIAPVHSRRHTNFSEIGQGGAAGMGRSAIDAEGAAFSIHPLQAGVSLTRSKCYIGTAARRTRPDKSTS